MSNKTTSLSTSDSDTQSLKNNKPQQFQCAMLTVQKLTKYCSDVSDTKMQ